MALNTAHPPASPDNRARVLAATMKRYQHQPDALIEVLHKAQELYGHLALDLLRQIARELKLPLSRVYGVATFYHFFSLTPAGEHTCTVCLGTACYVKGSAGVLAAIETASGVSAGTTAADGSFTLLTARCLGACGIAPAVVVDGHIVGHQTPESALDLLKGVNNGSGGT